jgi:hypothetical protein
MEHEHRGKLPRNVLGHDCVRCDCLVDSSKQSRTTSVGFDDQARGTRFPRVSGFGLSCTSCMSRSACFRFDKLADLKVLTNSVRHLVD